MNRWLAAALCGALLVLFTIVAYASVLTKAPTFDEPVQAVAGWLRLHHGDFRLNFEDPPLWEDWAALPNGAHALKPDFQSPEWKGMADEPPYQLQFASRSLFNTPGVDGAAFVNRSRAMMLVIGVLLGALIALWSWRLAGPAAAVVATALFALDPNFLGHAPLVKNDVSMALVLMGVAFLIWRLGQEVTAARAVGLMLACGAAANVKYSASLLAPILGLLLLFRALGPDDWRVLDRPLRSRVAKLAVVATIFAGIGVVTFGSIWALYGFRFLPTDDPHIHLRWSWVWDDVQQSQLAARLGGREKITPQDLAAWRPDVVARAVRWASLHHLLPEGYLNGFLYIYAASSYRPSFLLNTIRPTGSWYYFPLAMLLKTPLATLTGFLAAAIAAIALLRRRGRSLTTPWTVLCLVVPPGIYFASAMRANINIGVRHVLPVYGFLFVATGVLAAAALRRWKRPVVLVVGGLITALAAETAFAAPDFLAFFNAAVGGPTQGLSLLSDSNLDWGQDLTLLAGWQKQHPDVHLYVSYFGMVDPEYYGLRYKSLPCNYIFGPPAVEEPLQYPAVFAISATHLQGLGLGEAAGERYAAFRRSRAREVLGGTIYLYDVVPHH